MHRKYCKEIREGNIKRTWRRLFTAGSVGRAREPCRGSVPVARTPGPAQTLPPEGGVMQLGETLLLHIPVYILSFDRWGEWSLRGLLRGISR